MLWLIMCLRIYHMYIKSNYIEMNDKKWKVVSDKIILFNLSIFFIAIVI